MLKSVQSQGVLGLLRQLGGDKLADVLQGAGFAGKLAVISKDDPRRAELVRDIARHFATSGDYEPKSFMQIAKQLTTRELQTIIAIAPDRILNDLVREGLYPAGQRPDAATLKRAATAEITKNESKNYGLVYELIEKNGLRPVIDEVRAGRPGVQDAADANTVRLLFERLSAGERQAMLAALRNEKFLRKAPSADELVFIVRTGRAGEDEGAAVVKKPRVFVQPREARFGRGENNRVYELAYRGVNLGVNLGDVSKSPTTAVMCPTTPSLELGGGAIENVLAEAGGRDFDRNLAIVRNGLGEAELPYREATMMNATGELAKSGIQKLVLSAVTPDEGKGMTQEDMIAFTYNACMAAHRAGVDSLTVPAIGTGFAAAFGFGMSREDSMSGFVQGFKKFVDEVGNTPLERVDYNIYAPADMKNATQVANWLDELGVPRQLKE